MITATFVRDLPRSNSHTRQKLYQLSEPVEHGWSDDRGSTSYVIVSASDVPITGPETYIFAASKVGHVIDWGEMPGSFKGGLDYERALRGAGWEVAR